MKKVNLVIIIMISFVLGLVFGIKYKKYDMLYGYDPEEHWVEIEQDLKRNYADNDELPYYNKTKEEVLKMLHEPDFDDTIKIVNDSIFAFHKWYSDYWIKLCLNEDSVKYVNRLEWNNMPDEYKPKLVIIFEENNGTWVADKCIQWDPDKVLVD